MTSNEKPSSIDVSGSLNAVRLEGKIGNVKKVIHLYIDFMQINHRNYKKCQSFTAPSIVQHIIKNIKKTEINKDITYDLFGSVSPVELNYTSCDQLFQYPDKVSIFFNDNIIFDVIRNKTLPSRIFPNTRFHYNAIFHIYDDVIKLMESIKSNIRDSIYNIKIGKEKNYEVIDDMINIAKSKMAYEYKLLKTSDLVKDKNAKRFIPEFIEDLSLYTIEENTKAKKLLISKIKNNYNHSKIKDVVNGMIDTYAVENVKNILLLLNDISIWNNDLKNYFKVFYENRGKLLKLYDDYYNYGNLDEWKVFKRPVVEITMLNIKIAFNSIKGILRERHGAMLKSLETIRRILDKDYITNAFFYAPDTSSIYTLHTLVDKFDFKITHISINKLGTIEKLEDFIRNNKDPYQLMKYIYPNNFYQCVNLKNFPKYFM